MNSVKIVEDFGAAVWKARNPDAIDKYVVDDFVITTGGIDIYTKERLKEWVQQFLEKINDLEFEVVETFQNEDGSRVASRWRIRGKNNGVLGTLADQTPIAFTGKLSGRYAKMESCCITGLNAVLGSCFNN
jgi:hypothetical protein